MNEVSICNAALSYLGQKGTITRIKPPEGNPNAEACAEYYPQALRYLLEAHNWAFAIRRVRLPEYKKYDADLYQWAHGYQLPSDYLRTVKVYEKSRTCQSCRSISFRHLFSSLLVIWQVH